MTVKTKLLISVNTMAEAVIALNEGADIIDLKDPHVGALGALNLQTTEQIMQEVGNQAVISATVGDQHANSASLKQAINDRANLGLKMLKMAVGDCQYLIELTHFFNQYQQRNLQMIAVFFAEDLQASSLSTAVPCYADLLLIKSLGFYGAMIDTKTKKHDLHFYLNENQMRNFCQSCQTIGLISGLAGSLKPLHIDLMRCINPKYIGFRGGVCEKNDRVAALSIEKVQLVRKMLHQSHIEHIKKQKSMQLVF
jgi:(5-formylfuran-3-yl)methyl phosphate synthase